MSRSMSNTQEKRRVEVALPRHNTRNPGKRCVWARVNRGELHSSQLWSKIVYEDVECLLCHETSDDCDIDETRVWVFM